MKIEIGEALAKYNEPKERMSFLKADGLDLFQDKLGEETNVISIIKPSYTEISVIHNSTHYVVAYTNNSSSKQAVEMFKSTASFSSPSLTSKFLQHIYSKDLVERIDVFKRPFGIFFFGAIFALQYLFFVIYALFIIVASILILVLGFLSVELVELTFTDFLVNISLVVFGVSFFYAHHKYFQHAEFVGRARDFVIWPILTVLFAVAGLFLLFSNPFMAFLSKLVVINLPTRVVLFLGDPNSAVILWWPIGISGIIFETILAFFAIAYFRQPYVKKWYIPDNDIPDWIFKDSLIGKGFIQGGTVKCGRCGYVFIQKDPKKCWVCGSDQIISSFNNSEKQQ